MCERMIYLTLASKDMSKAYAMVKKQSRKPVIQAVNARLTRYSMNKNLSVFFTPCKPGNVKISYGMIGVL